MNYEYERVPTPASGLRLHLNENTAGCSPRVLAAIHAMTREQAAWYPDYDAPVAATASRLGISSGELLLTNGLDEGILLVSLAALRGRSAEDPCEAVVVQPAFDMYAACADAVGGKVIEIQPEPDFAFPRDAVLRAIGAKTRVVFLTHPNNPTGLPLDRETMIGPQVSAKQLETMGRTRDAGRLHGLGFPHRGVRNARRRHAQTQFGQL